MFCQKSLIEPTNNQNPNNKLYNNLKAIIKTENIKEYQITLDSVDRNITNYPDPFKINYSLRSFRNVKYIKIDSVILPKYYDVIDEQTEDTSKDTTKQRFILLKFNNIDILNFGSNTNNFNSILLYPYRQYNNFSLFRPVNMNTSILCNPTSSLTNLNNIEFTFYDGEYNQIKFSHKDINELDKTKLTCPLNVNKQVVINLRVGIMENNMNTEVNYR